MPKAINLRILLGEVFLVAAGLCLGGAFWGSPDVSVGQVTVTRPGRGGHSPPSFSIAREISA